MKKKKERILGTPKKRGKFFTFFKGFLRIFTRKPKIINLNDKIEDRAIYLSNHSGSSGPFTLEMFFPKYFVPWGTYEMCGGYRDRWKYLYHVYLRQKKKVPAFFAFIAATVAACFTGMFYRGLQLVATYPDNRMLSTLRYTHRLLDEGRGILIFPENSSDGYKAVLEEFFAGFVLLAKTYFKHSGVDLPVYTVYWDKKANTMVIDKPEYCNALLKSGKTAKQVAEFFKDKANALRSAFILKETALPA